MRIALQIDPWVFLLIALLLLTLPLKWIGAAFFAAVIHEICHMVMIRLSGGKIYGIKICAGGAVILTQIDDIRSELLSAAAGPIGSLALMGLYPLTPRIAICGCIQGMFNLLPMGTLDGGRIVKCLLKRYFPKRAEWIWKWIQLGCLAVIFLMLLYLGGTQWRSFPVLVIAVVGNRCLKRKMPCKWSKIGVQ